MKSNYHTFRLMGLSPVLLTAVKKANYARPTKIQSDVIPGVLAGGDMLVSAETGSGKTAAFVLPLLQKLIDQRHTDGRQCSRRPYIQALILVPTRELVVQVRQEVTRLACDISPEVRCLSVYGGVRTNSQKKAVRHGVDILVATPSRLLELADEFSFNKLHTLVVDEADRLVSAHFKGEVEAIFKLLPKKCQHLLFTATFPESIRELVRVVLHKPTIIKHDHQTERFIEQHVVCVNYDQKHALLAELLKANDWRQVLVFCSAKKTCDRVVEKLTQQGLAAYALHGNKAQKERLQVLAGFKSKKYRVLIATDVASRGIDVESLDCVINFELPRSPNDYIHRIGRTGRAGRTGQAISLISHHEYAHFAVIEKRNGMRLEREQVPGFEASAEAPPPPKTNSRKKAGKQTGKKRKGKKKFRKNQCSKKQSRLGKQRTSPAAVKKVTDEDDNERGDKKTAVNEHIWSKKD